MLLENAFARRAILPSWWANAIQRRLSNGYANVVLSKKNDTTIQVVAGPDEDAAVLDVKGHWRWKTRFPPSKALRLFSSVHSLASGGM